MRTIDLRDYVVTSWGDWMKDPNAYTSNMLRLDTPDDGLTLSGPVRVRVSVQARNLFHFPGTNRLEFQLREMFSYVLDIPPGQTWSYPGPRRHIDAGLHPDLTMVSRYAATVEASSNPWWMGSSSATVGGRHEDTEGSQPHAATPVGGQPSSYYVPPPPAVGVYGPPAPGPTYVPPPPAMGIHNVPGGQPTYVPPPPGVMVAPPPPVVHVPPRFPGLGTNAGVTVIIRPAGSVACEDPCNPDPCGCAERDPCAPKRPECGCGGGKGHDDCGCGCGGGKKGHGDCGCGGVDTLPCDFGVVGTPNAGKFFPVACEPCRPGSSIALPPVKGPALMVSPARGGTVRTRYFTGMFITKEDLETDQRNVRLKRALMNKAMGQGVVWGLRSGLDGDAVCVLPGYGVDCCGNDLVLTQAYRVEAEALVRDPAARALLAEPGPKRMHLVLEYFECPEAVRPVHGDPCANDARCEPSRVRETVRLRLAPPCDVDDSGPIKEFLEEVEQLKSDTTVMGMTETGGTSTMTMAMTVAPRVPFTVTVAHTAPGGSTLGPLQPDVNNQIETDLDTKSVQPPFPFKITFTAEAGTSFRMAPVLQILTFNPTTGVITGISQTVSPTFSPGMVEWNVDIQGMLTSSMPILSSPSTFDPIVPAIAFDVGMWEVQDQNGALFQGMTRINLTPIRSREWHSTPWGAAHRPSVQVGPQVVLHVAIPRTGVKVTSTAPPKFPCLSEPCGNGTKRLFPVMPPWLHEDPTKPGQAADPKVILLAVLYAMTTGLKAQYSTGTPYSMVSARAELGEMIGAASSKLFFGATTPEQKARIIDALQRLLRAWCCALLYPGPKCRCDPHGVVVGCATVDGGTIVDVDPWGGRRWVVHYPLLAYWGQQFGIMPPDAIASKLFGIICCFAGVAQPPKREPTQPPPFIEAPAPARPPLRTTFHPMTAAGEGSAVPLGRAILLTGSDPQMMNSLRSLGVTPRRSVRLNPVDFIDRVTRAFSSSDPGVGERPMMRVSVMGIPELSLVLPDEEAPVETAAAEPTVVGARPVPASPLREVIRTSVTTRTRAAAVPRLLRGVTESLVAEIAGAIPLEAAQPPEEAVVGRLRVAGVGNAAAVLEHDAEVLHGTVLGKESPVELNAILDRSERLVQAISKEVGDSVTAFSTERGLASREGLADPQLAAELGKRLGERLRKAKLPAPADEVLAAMVASSAGGKAPR